MALVGLLAGIIGIVFFQLKQFCHEVDDGTVSTELQEKLYPRNSPPETKIPVNRESQDSVRYNWHIDKTQSDTTDTIHKTYVKRPLKNRQNKTYVKRPFKNRQNKDLNDKW